MTLHGLRGIEPKLGRYDFDGACVQVGARGNWRTGGIYPLSGYQESFSLGIFAYAQRADGGLKRGKAVRRITGYFGTGDRAPERAFEEAERVCGELERKGD